MASRRLDDLQSEVRNTAREHLLKCNDQGVGVLVYCTYRAPDEQARLFWQGREPEQVERRAKRLERFGCHGLAELLRSAGPQNGPKVTFAGPGESYHQYGIAYDCVPVLDGKLVWSVAGSAGEVWDAVGAAGIVSGLEWAGTWRRFREYPHFQLAGAPPVHDLMVERFFDLSSDRFRLAEAAGFRESDVLRAALAEPNTVFMVFASSAGASDEEVDTVYQNAVRVADSLAPEVWRAFWVRDPADLDDDLVTLLTHEAEIHQAVVLSQGTGLDRMVASAFTLDQLPDSFAVADAFSMG